MITENEIRNHLSLSNSNEINILLKPLLDLLKIRYFAFYRIYEDTGRILLSNYPEWEEFFYSNLFTFETGLFEKNPKLFRSGYVFWDPHLFNYSDAHKVRREFNVEYGFAIAKRHETYLDVFFLSCNKEYYNQSLFLCYIQLIERYIDHFMKETSKTIKILERNRFFLPFTDEYLPCDDKSGLIITNESADFKLFSENTPVWI